MDVDTCTKVSSLESDSGEGEKVVYVHVAQNFFRIKSRHSHLPCSYRLIRIHSKGAMFMIIINALFASTIMEITERHAADLQHPSLKKSIFLKVAFVSIVLSSLLCPLVGLLSDSYVGRYKILIASLYLWLVSIIFMALDVIILSETALYCLHILALGLSLACFIACVLPFTIDQLVGASGEQLSFTIYWIVWAWLAYANTQDFVHSFISLPYQLHQTILFSLLSSSFILAYVMVSCCDHVLMTKPQLSNPIKLIARVLNYARKHKFPERRSAFTYWEDECPSRIDLGKEKYGGPFTVEEVENVKTVFKLLPLIICIMGILAQHGDTGGYMVHVRESNNPQFYSSLLRNIVMVSWLPIYHFMIYPFFYNYIPSMLRRIGIGIFLIVSSELFRLMMYIAFSHQFSWNGSNATSINSENEVNPA